MIIPVIFSRYSSMPELTTVAQCLNSLRRVHYHHNELVYHHARMFCLTEFSILVENTLLETCWETVPPGILHPKCREFLCV